MQVVTDKQSEDQKSPKNTEVQPELTDPTTDSRQRSSMLKYGMSGNVDESAASSNTFGDGRERTAAGRYGRDQVTRLFTTPKSFVRKEFQLNRGKYDFGLVRLDINSHGIAAQYVHKGPDLYSQEINKSMHQLERGAGLKFNPDLVAQLRNALLMLGGPVASLSDWLAGIIVTEVKIKSFTIEGPGVSLETGLSLSKKIGGKGSIQATALVLTLDTPLGEITGKLKLGVGYGATLEPTRTKRGAPGTRKTLSVSALCWELNYTPSCSLLPEGIDALFAGEQEIPRNMRVPTVRQINLEDPFAEFGESLVLDRLLTMMPFPPDFDQSLLPPSVTMFDSHTLLFTPESPYLPAGLHAQLSNLASLGMNFSVPTTQASFSKTSM